MFLALAIGLAASALVALPSRVWAADMTAPPGAPYKPVQELAPLPDFVPGLGSLYVDPSTLPAGPFLGYDRKGKLVNSVYMIPMDDLNARKEFKHLNAGQAKVDHVTMDWVGGHPGVTQPHYHIVIWYVSPKEASALK
jgi:hypothetical protein